MYNNGWIPGICIIDHSAASNASAEITTGALLPALA